MWPLYRLVRYVCNRTFQKWKTENLLEVSSSCHNTTWSSISTSLSYASSVGASSGSFHGNTHPFRTTFITLHSCLWEPCFQSFLWQSWKSEENSKDIPCCSSRHYSVMWLNTGDWRRVNGLFNSDLSDGYKQGYKSQSLAGSTLTTATSSCMEFSSYKKRDRRYRMASTQVKRKDSTGNRTSLLLQ